MIKPVLVCALWLIVAAALQAALSVPLSIGFASPDFLLIAGILLSFHQTSDAASVIGFFAGLLTGSLVNASLFGYSVSRMFACLFSLRLYTLFIGESPVTVAGVTALATLISGGIFLFLGVPKNLLGHIADTIGSAIYNGALAFLAFGLIRSVARSPSRV